MRVEDVETILRLVVPRPHVEAGWLAAQIRDSGALLEGHFEQLCGTHAQFFLRFQQLGWSDEVSDRLAELLIEDRPPRGVQQVLSAESAGSLLGRAVARRLNIDLHVAKVDALRRPIAQLVDGDEMSAEPVVVVHDLVTSGRSLQSLLQVAAKHGAPVAAVFVFGLHQGSSLDRQLQVVGVEDGRWLATLDWDVEPADRCSMCAEEAGPLLPAAEFN